jgi:hypothetical protein
MPNTTRTKLHSAKLHAVAQFAQFCVRNPDLLSDKLIPQTLGIAVRKLHDFGKCGLGSGKYLGHPYWSRKARSLLIQNSRKLQGIQIQLAHEHVIPIKLIVRELLLMPKQTTVREFENMIRRMSLVAIITREEEITYLRAVKPTDAPKERWFVRDPWWRYRKAGLLSSIVNESGKRINV